MEFNSHGFGLGFIAGFEGVSQLTTRGISLIPVQQRRSYKPSSQKVTFALLPGTGFPCSSKCVISANVRGPVSIDVLGRKEASTY
jgi:hypothetical protein